MTRVINMAGPGKRRNQLRRTIAEVLRHLMLKRELDQEAKDMAALLVLSLHGIAETVETTVTAWEKRNYFLKADRFRLEWEWVEPTAQRLEEIILNEHWGKLPQELASLAPHFGDIRIAKMTRPPSTWESSYRLLVQRSRQQVDAAANRSQGRDAPRDSLTGRRAVEHATRPNPRATEGPDSVRRPDPQRRSRSRLHRQG